MGSPWLTESANSKTRSHGETGDRDARSRPRPEWRWQMSDEKDWSELDPAIVENYAAGRPRDDANLGRARVELLKRDHRYAEEQEQSRRQYEDDRAATRREHEEQLMRRQMEHASKLAQEQLDATRAVEKAANRVAWAAGLAALGAIAQAIIAAAIIAAVVAYYS